MTVRRTILEVFGLLCIGAALGCGRIGYDAVGQTDGGSPPLIDAREDFFVSLPCGVDQFTLDMLPGSDQIRFFATGENTLSVIAIHHDSDVLHTMHHYELVVSESGIAGTDLGVVYSRPEVAGFALEEVPAGYVMVLSDSTTTEMHVLDFDSGFALQNDRVIGSIEHGYPPFARSSAGQMVVGRDGSNSLVALPIDANVQPIGSSNLLAGAIDVAVSIAPDGADFMVAWSSAGSCEFARINTSGNIVAGPVALSPAGDCAFPFAARLASGRIAYTVHDGATGMYRAYAGTIDAALSTATPPILLSTPFSLAFQLHVEDDLALIPVLSNDTVRIVELSAAGQVSSVGADFGVLSSGQDVMQLESVNGQTILVRTEAQQMVVRRICR